MFESLSLRLRVFLFFLLIAFGGAAVVSGALFIGFQRSVEGDVLNGFIFSAVLSLFGFMGLSMGIWLLFDENVAKPIERVAASMRTRAHAGVNVQLSAEEARYLGDLAPAAQAVAGQLNQTEESTAEAVATQTAQLATEKEFLTALLTEIPIAMIIVSPSHQIVLYDGQAAEVLGQIHVPRLNASIFDYLSKDTLKAAHTKMVKSGMDVSFEAQGTEGRLSFDARLKPLGATQGYMIVIDEAHAEISPEAARPLVYDFDLLEHEEDKEFEHRAVMGLNFVVFDTETTGLLPHKDEVVQLGAVRVVNGRIIPGESIDQLVNPGMKIPPASTKVHHVTDAMVADAPDAHVVSKQFHVFARDSVIVAHNAPFDMAFLRRYGKENGLSWDHPIIDTVLLSAVLFGASETHTLDALCERLGVTIPAHLRHTALGDAYATAEVLCKMLPMLKSRGYATFGEVIQQTRKHGRLLEDLN
ncbi:3'-5' exonuclease [Shimia thalassica]|uniref:3'-5' exonuclease n=1 Tax=Shimia thalassica TaxID=1715693 RepID=UPI00249536C1|nr:3'-5' exonuclease [Shimia thalassica]MDO6481899.1 3'-5' exonuclease [Shimia thalassica]MDO6521203.1 3'-5' exonuclease [Shimia thalassica]MDO6800631.1 3'-5' exonuclease [Shimia thalassica]MDP2520649.1 3'-5' exonuclease [Shimia thalassica]MDP2582276.1 3'-5' exonuclease [Shimia thalassica]